MLSDASSLAPVFQASFWLVRDDFPALWLVDDHQEVTWLARVWRKIGAVRVTMCHTQCWQCVLPLKEQGRVWRHGAALLNVRRRILTPPAKEYDEWPECCPLTGCFASRDGNYAVRLDGARQASRLCVGRMAKCQRQAWVVSVIEKLLVIHRLKVVCYCYIEPLVLHSCKFRARD
jgi:hypothetical protein